jgi:IstB-like ATP binding protein
MRLGKRYSAERLEAACQRSLTLGACAYKSLESIPKNGLDRRPLPPPPEATAAKTDLLILDDWGLAPFSDEHRRDLLEIVEDRHDCRATLVTSQLPVEHWHGALGDPTLADASLDRLVHHAYKITLQGESMRKRQVKLTRGATAE